MAKKVNKVTKKKDKIIKNKKVVTTKKKSKTTKKVENAKTNSKIEKLELELEPDLEKQLDEIVVDLDVDLEVEEEKEPEKKVNKHKIPGKHRLKYDSIFKGKKQENLKPEDPDPIISRSEGFDIDPFSASYTYKYDFEEYDRLKKMREDVYRIILEKTEINLKNNRRKPGRVDFNQYFQVLVSNLDMRDYTHAEVFLELVYYFSENEYNMFKLLDQKWGAKIVKELSHKFKINDLDKLDFI